MASMAEASKMLMFFKSLQRKKGVTDTGNVLQQKWDMRDVMADIPPEDIKKLMRFYMDVDEEKSIQRFFMKYHEYYETMQDTIRERRRSRAAIKQTMERISGE